MGELFRLDHYIAECGVGSRKQAIKIIKAGRISVDGNVVTTPGLKIDTDSIIMFDEQKLSYEKYVYYMLNKPMGCVTATKDNLSKTVIELMKGVNTKGLFPVGRLDKDTEGMLLITNDGEFSHAILSPKKHVSKTYYVISDIKLKAKDLKQFAVGVDIGDEKPCLPAKISYIEKNKDGFCYELTIYEGRFHQVKRMFYTYGANVLFLKRTAMGALCLDDSLNPGEFKKLSAKEVEMVKG